MSDPILSAQAITKRYPGVVALDSVSIGVYPNEVVGLVGANGSGKSTLLKILAGVIRPDAGSVQLAGTDVTFRSVRDAMDHGIGMVFQEQSLIPNLTLAENIFLGRERDAVRHGVFDWGALWARTAPVLESVSVAAAPSAVTSTLSFADRQMVEVARAMTCEDRQGNLRAVLFDEPTSVLGQAQVDTLFAQIRALKARASAVFVSHRLDEVLAVSDRIYVMRNGIVVAERATRDVQPGELYELMVGRAESGGYYREDAQQTIAPDNAACLSVEHLGAAGRFDDVSFAVAPGEIVGLLGIEASGRDGVVRALAGVEPYGSGQIVLDGKSIEVTGPADAIRYGIGYVPSERRTEAVVGGMSAAENLTLPNLRQFSRWGVLRPRVEAAAVAHWVGRLNVKLASPASLIDNLSGGNQQKIVLARWLMRDDLRVLILDHPTRGLDVGAKAEVYDVIRQLSARGVAMIVLGDTLEESVGLSHRLVAMREGRTTMTFDAPAGTKPALATLIPYIM